jgi:hypothetical protein
MTQYTIYLFDGRPGEPQFEELECGTDAEAINMMLDRVIECPIELWCGGRKVLARPASVRCSTASPAWLRQRRALSRPSDFAFPGVLTKWGDRARRPSSLAVPN